MCNAQNKGIHTDRKQLGREGLGCGERWLIHTAYVKYHRARKNVNRIRMSVKDRRQCFGFLTCKEEFFQKISKG